MNGVASWLVLALVSLPALGVLMALALRASASSRAQVVAAFVRWGIFACFIASMALLAILSGSLGTTQATATWSLGTAWSFDGPTPLRVDWAWQVNLFSAGWIAVLSGLTWLALTSVPHNADGSDRGARDIATGLLLIAAVSLVLSVELVPMLFCWGAISLATSVLTAVDSNSEESSRANRRMILTGLCSDGLLVLAVLLMCTTCGTTVIDNVLSSDGLAKLAQRTPALPGFIGCLLVLGVLGRGGLFPCFGWHVAASGWNRTTWTMVYVAGYVPSMLWILIRFQPLIARYEVSLSLLGGLGTLGAVLGSFVACGQREQRVAWAYLVTSQFGVVMAALSSGLFDVAFLQAWWNGAADAAPHAGQLVRVALGQLAVLTGVVVAWRTALLGNTLSSNPRSTQPLAELSRRRLYIDEVTQLAIEGPVNVWSQIAQIVERFLSEDFWPTLGQRIPGWFGRQLESMQIGRVEFDVAACLLGVATLLLTLALVS